SHGFFLRAEDRRRDRHVTGVQTCALPLSYVYDLTFEIDGSSRQIDAILLFNNECVIFEVKNYVGDFIYKDDEFYTYHTMQKISSPFVKWMTRLRSFVSYFID